MEFKKFRIDISSDLDYEDLIAEIMYENHTFAILTQEKGYENLEIMIYPPIDSNQKSWVFNFAEFNGAIQSAKKALWELRKFPDEGNQPGTNNGNKET